MLGFISKTLRGTKRVMGNTKDITEKLKNGKTGKNDRKNVQKLLILVLKYT